MLRFSLSDIPVGVHFSFLIVALFGGFTVPLEIAMWLIAAFAAVLLHEAGHAFTARHFGAVPVRITLFAMGGVTVYPANEDLTAGRRFLIAAAGSTVGIVTGGLLLLATQTDVVVPGTRLLDVLVLSYIWASLGWGILNWIPIRPLDGGAMLTSLLEIVSPRRGVVIARYASLVVGLVLAGVLQFRFGRSFLALFVLFITFAGFGDRSDAPRDEVEIVEGPEHEIADQPPAEGTTHDEPDTSFPI